MLCKRLQSFASFWKSPYILSFTYIPSTQSRKVTEPPPRFPGAGVLLFAKGSPFAQFTKISAKDGWAMLLWAHSAFQVFNVSCESALPSMAALLNGLCLLLALQHLTNGYRAMQLHILARWTHSVFRACGVSYASFLLSAAGCLIEYVHVYTLHKLPSI